MRVIDSAESAADAAADLINGKDETASGSLPLQNGAMDASIRCFATDSVEKFERLGSHFLGRPVGNVELVDLGG
jgi:glutamate racemase